MDLMKTDYEFLDLSDVKEAERNSLRVTLFQLKVDKLAKINRVKPILEIHSSQGYKHRSLSPSERRMSVPAESGPGSGGELAGDDLTPHSPQRGGAPPPYAPPPYVPPWAPPNVYVSQVTANVNVHGYMGQYYQQPTFAPPERPPRTHRRTDRRHKRPPSPPPQPPPYYVHYPPYYGQQSTPLYLYHHPLAYVGHYPYHYYPEYPVPVDAEPDKAPEEYPPEVVMEQEAVDAYYAGAHYAGPSYGPPVEGPVEYIQPMYAPPMPHQPPMPMPPQQPPPQSTPHQFNVHAKNFIHNPVKAFVPPPESSKSIEPKPSPPVHSPVESLTIKELKIIPDAKPSTSTSSASSTPSEKASPVELPKPVQVTPEPSSPPAIAKVVPPVAPVPAVVPAGPKPAKSKSPAAPFSGTKPTPKPTPSVPKAPFGNRQRREEEAESALPPSKAPMPISITLQSAGAPLIVSNKSPFGRKPPPAPSPPPPPPPAPTASDFPPPPTPRNRVDPLPTTLPTPPTPAAPGKSWASLFNKATAIEETITQKPVAKVPPFDSSPKPSVSYSEKTSVATPTVTPSPGVSGKTSVRSVSPESRDAPVKDTPTHPSPFADDPNSYRMGEFLSKYQLEHKAVALLPRGLTNRSNYCYINAILQALIACPPFYNMLKALPYQTRRGKSSTPIIDATVELCYEFTPLPPNSRVSRSRGTESAGAGALPVQTGAPLDPSAGQKVLRALRPFPGSQEGRQEDAEEFLSCLLNGLNDEMLELIKLVEPEDKEEQTNGIALPPPEEEDDDDDWKVMGPRNKGAVERRWPTGRTPLADIFRGRTRCRTHRAPSNASDNVQPFFTLQLDIERSNNVKEALELLGGKDALEGVGDSWQQLSIEQPPVVLLLHLKCFQLHAEGHPIKIVKNFEYPIELKIDPKVLSPKMKYTAKQKQYKLFAVVYHEGVEAVKGHYLTDTYHGQAGWIRYDDSTVTIVTDAQVLKPKPPKMPYLLMYRRMDMIPTPHRSNAKTE